MSSYRVEHDGTAEIVCPNCGYEYEESWELQDQDGGEIECPDCERHFILTVKFPDTDAPHGTYSTYSTRTLEASA